jgi:hypothetical protein
MAEFDKDQALDEPELVAASWWRAADAQRGPDLSRRGALLGLAGLTAAATLATNTACSTSDPGPTVEKSLDLQKKHGWDFGATKTLKMQGDPVPKATFDTLAQQLLPTNPKHKPFARTVLFDSVRQATKATNKLADAIRPVHTPAMENAELAGRGLSSLFAGAPEGKAIMVDLPGPEAVAFAAGLANRFDPVFVMENWPHPMGTVPSHLTLAAAIDRLPTFERMAAARPKDAPPAFILDSNRLSPFTDQQFDNRYVVPMPSADALKKLGVSEVLMVRPTAADQELDDQNDTLNEWLAKGINVQLVPATHFKPVPEGKDPHDYGERDPDAPVAVAGTGAEGIETDVGGVDGGGTYSTTHRHTNHHHYAGYGAHFLFWSHYGFGRSPFTPRSSLLQKSSYQVKRRSTRFGKSARPAGFGQAAVDTRGGKPSLSRSQSKSSGSWGRSRGGGYS